MSLPALHLLRLNEPTEMKRQADELDQADNYDDGKRQALGNTSGTTSNDKEPQESAPKETFVPKVLILDFDHVMSSGTVKRLVIPNDEEFDRMAKEATESLGMTYESKKKESDSSLFKPTHLTADTRMYASLTDDDYVELFGGLWELQKTKNFFGSLAAKEDVEPFILTYAPQANVMKALKAVGLIEVFSDRVYDDEGNETEYIEGNRIYGKEWFDQKFPDESGHKFDGVAEIVETLKEAYGLTNNDLSKMRVVYVDDDKDNLYRADIGVEPMVFKNRSFNEPYGMPHGSVILHTWSIGNDTMFETQHPRAFSTSFDPIEEALEIKPWADDLDPLDFIELSKFYSKIDSETDDPKDQKTIQPEEVEKMWHNARTTGNEAMQLSMLQVARRLYWEEVERENGGGSGSGAGAGAGAGAGSGSGSGSGSYYRIDDAGSDSESLSLGEDSDQD